MEITTQLNRLNTKATMVGFALLASLAIVTLWSVQYVYGFEMTRTVLATHEFTNSLEFQSRVYHTYEDFSDEGLTARYTYHYVNPVDGGCANSYRMAISTNSLNEVVVGSIMPGICSSSGNDDTIYHNWGGLGIDFGANDNLAGIKSVMYQGFLGSSSFGWNTDFDGTSLDIEHFCIQSYGDCIE